ncbi:MAG: DUF692 domain-containing protein [Nitratireductor sp.]|nr:DUF692 domain-containing protein [Nitratireductor sp.]MCB1460712.1 DUF692 domain-containing protein [Nitratireductor sp.]
MQETILNSSLPEFACHDRRLPRRAGVGLKPEHVAEIVGTRPDIGFFEVHAENYMGAGGMPHAQLRSIREQYALSVHGVGMSIGGEADLDREHLARLKAVVDIYQPSMVSEHLAWSTHDDIFFNDLLPLPYTHETLARVVRHVDMVQNALGRQILIENPSTYVIFAQSDWEETQFMAEVSRRSGCGLLLDVNNIFVSSVNNGTSPAAYVAAYPVERVQQIHLAGHAADSDDEGKPLLIDAHDRQVSEDVWALYAKVLERTGPLPTLIEWDNDVPQWSVLKAESERADRVLKSCAAPAAHLQARRHDLAAVS